MTVPLPLVYIIAGVVGIGIAIQVAANSSLGIRSASPSFSVLMSFLTGLVLVFIYFFIEADWGRNVDMSGVKSAPWWAWTGGVLGAIYVTVITIFSQHIGVASMTAVIFSAQMITASVIDTYGWLDMSERPFTALRGGGLALLLVGTILLAVG